MPDRTWPEGSQPSGGSGEWLVIDGIAHRRVVLCFIFRSSSASGASSRQVLLGLKRTGFGAGRVVAIGGKIDGVETDLQAAVREVQEESGLQLRPSAVRRIGRISWTFPAHPSWSMAASLFAADADGTTPVPCEEIEPRWYGVDSIPWDSMWKDAPHWLPSLLAGEERRQLRQGPDPVDGLLEVRIVMAEDNENVADAVVLRVGDQTRRPVRGTLFRAEPFTPVRSSEPGTRNPPVQSWPTCRSPGPS